MTIVCCHRSSSERAYKLLSFFSASFCASGDTFGLCMALIKKDISDHEVSDPGRVDLRLETSCNVVEVLAFGTSLQIMKLLLGFSLTLDGVVWVVNRTTSGLSVSTYH